MTDVHHMVSHVDCKLKLPEHGIIVLAVGNMHLYNNCFCIDAPETECPAFAVACLCWSLFDLCACVCVWFASQ